MKFQEAHRLDILECFKKAGLQQSQFFFRKKRGRIFVEENESKKWFSYFFKDDSFIDLISKERIEAGTWEVKTSSKEAIDLESWTLVIKELKGWLKQLK